VQLVARGAVEEDQARARQQIQAKDHAMNVALHDAVGLAHNDFEARLQYERGRRQAFAAETEASLEGRSMFIRDWASSEIARTSAEAAGRRRMAAAFAEARVQRAQAEHARARDELVNELATARTWADDFARASNQSRDRDLHELRAELRVAKADCLEMNVRCMKIV